MLFQLDHNHSRSAKQRGFTLVEMLIVVPIALLVVATLIGAMVAMIGDAIVANATSEATYNTQDALTRIEQDTRVAINFGSTLSLLASPQGKDGNTAPFQSSNGDLIITQQATTASPYQAARNLVYYANQPNACGSASITSNRVLLARVVYFLKTNGDGTQTLWRRTVLNPANVNGTVDPNTVCNSPWQRNSCPIGSPTTPIIGSSPCQGFDEKMLDNVSAFTVTYYTPAGTTTTDPSLADSIGVQISSSRQLAGHTIDKTGAVRAKRTNDSPATPAPTTPDISILNPLLTDYNNSIKATVQWSSPFATYYMVSTQVGVGAWTTPVLTTDTSTVIATDYAKVTYHVKVTAYNDYGQTADATFNGETMLWTPCNLMSNWAPYGSPYGPAAFTITSAKVVMLSGLIKNGNGSQGEVICNLPPGFRPDNRLIFSQTTSGATRARVDATANGNVIFYWGSTSWLSLNGITFLASGAYPWTNLTAAGTWAPYDSPSTPKVTKDSSGRAFIEGLAKNSVNPAAASTAFAFPSGYSTGTGNSLLFPAGGPNGMIGSVQIYSGVFYRYTSNAYWSLQAMFYPDGSTTWTPANLTASGAGWGQYSSGWASAQFTKNPDNIVSLQGLIKGGSIANPTLLFTLPPGNRPAKDIICSQLAQVAGGDGFTRIDVRASDGGVILREGSYIAGGWISLSGCNFYADGS